MTDLCYNCGSCHLPQPCGVPMAKCLICESHGHTWNFCHRGCHAHQPGYLYYAICHNCDAWHLPTPCDKAEVHCSVCDQIGHLPYYCPISPVPHSKQALDTSPTNSIVDHTGTKRKRVDNDPSDPASYGVVLPNNTTIPFNAHQLLFSPLMADEAYTLKMDAVGAAMALAPYHKPHEIFAILAKKFLNPSPSVPSGSSTLRPHTQMTTGLDARLIMPAYQTPGQFHDGINAPASTPRAQSPQQQHQRPHLQNAYSAISATHGDAIVPEERLEPHQQYQDRRMKHLLLQQQTRHFQNDQQPRWDPARYSGTVSNQTTAPDMANQLANRIAMFANQGLAAGQNVQYGAMHGGRGEGEYGPSVDVGRQDNVRLDISADGRASVVSTDGRGTTFPSVEREAYASTNVSEPALLPYGNMTVQSTSSGFGGMADDIPHTKAPEGSPKAPAKRTRKAPANPRPRGKTVAAKAKEAKEAALAEQVQQQAQAQDQHQAQQHAQQEAQQQAREEGHQAHQQVTIQQQAQQQDQQQTQGLVQQSQQFQQPLSGSEGP